MNWMKRPLAPILREDLTIGEAIGLLALVFGGGFLIGALAMLTPLARP